MRAPRDDPERDKGVERPGVFPSPIPTAFQGKSKIAVETAASMANTIPIESSKTYLRASAIAD